MPVRRDSRNRSWYYRFYRGQSYFGGGFRTKEDAKDAEAKQRTAIDATGVYLENPAKNRKLTFEEASKLFYDKHASKKRSWVTSRAMIKILTASLGKYTLKQIGHERLEAALNEIQRNRHQSELTWNHYASMVRAIYNRLKKWRVYSGDNPTLYLEMKKVPRVRVRFLYPAEEKVLSPVVLADSEIWPYYFTALHTGMRLSEICRMKVEDIDYIRGNIFVPDSKTHRSRHIQMSEDLAGFLPGYTAGKVPEASALFKRDRYWVGKRFTALCKQAKIERFTFHCLRHSFAARLLGRGVPIYKVSKFLGHSSVQVTEQHYGHLNPADLQGAIKEIQGVITGPFAAVCSSSESLEVKTVDNVVKIGADERT